MTGDRSSWASPTKPAGIACSSMVLAARGTDEVGRGDQHTEMRRQAGRTRSKVSTSCFVTAYCEVVRLGLDRPQLTGHCLCHEIDTGVSIPNVQATRPTATRGEDIRRIRDRSGGTTGTAVRIAVPRRRCVSRQLR